MIKHFKRYITVYIFLLISILTVFGIFVLIKEIEYKSFIKAKRTETLRKKNAIEEQILQNLNILKLVQVYIEKNPLIKRIEFSKIITSVVESNQSILAIEWIPKISNSQRFIYEEGARRDGFKNFAIKEFDKNGNIVTSGIRDFYYPVYYLEPFGKNEKVFGFDISTYSFAKKNFNKTVDKYGLAFSSGIKLIQDTSVLGLVVYLPVFNIIDNHESNNKKEIISYISGVYETSFLIRNALGKFNDEYAIQINDVTDTLKVKKLFTNNPVDRLKYNVNKNFFWGSSPTFFVNRYTIETANLKWEIVFDSYLKEKFWSFSSVFLLIGCVLSTLVAYALFINKKSTIGNIQLNRLLSEEQNKRKEYEEERKESEEKFSKLFLYSPIPIIFIRFKDRIIADINHAFESQFNFNKAEVIGKTSLNIGLWVNVEDWENYYRIFFEKGEVVNYEMHAKSTFNEINTYLVTGKRIKFSDEEYILNFFQNITVRKNYEVALQESEQKYREIYNSVNDVILIVDIEKGSIIDANLRATEFFGYSIEEFKMVGIINLITNKNPYTYEALSKLYFKNKGSSISENIEWQVKSREGKVFDVDINFKETLINERRNIIVVIHDISERKRAEKLLGENEFLFRSQFDNSNLGIVISSPEKEFIRANKKFCTMLGYSEEELQGRLWKDYTFSEDIDKETPLYTKLVQGEQDRYEISKRYLRKDGGSAFAQVSVSCFRNPDQSILYIIAYVFEITDRIEIENKLVKAIIETEERERSRFAQELHDGLGPLLSSIKMYTQWMLKPGANIKQVDVLEQIENLANLSNQSVKEIAFGLSPHILKDFGIIEALQSFISKVNATSEVKFEISNNLSHRFDETTETIIYRILTECISNSLKHSRADHINIVIMESEKYLDIEYSDNGVGFDLNEVIDKKFGMGLHNIKNRLNSINGKLLIFSQVNKGTTFKINILL